VAANRRTWPAIIPLLLLDQHPSSLSGLSAGGPLVSAQWLIEIKNVAKKLLRIFHSITTVAHTPSPKKKTIYH